MDFTEKSIAGMKRSEWLKLRNESIGGSDMAIIMNLNDFKSGFELWGEKVGTSNPSKFTNEMQFWGIELEEKIADIYQYWENDFETTHTNRLSGVKKRTVEKPEKMFYSKEYPFMHSNPDGIVVEDGKKGLLEVKTTSKFNLDKYAGGLPPYYLIQMQHYLSIFGYDWCDLAFLCDGRELRVVRFDRNEVIIKKIREVATRFWDEVVSARKALKDIGEHGIIEPEWLINGGSATAEYLSKKHKLRLEETEIEGDFEDGEKAVKINELKGQINELKKAKQLHENILKKKMIGNAKMILPNGRITWRRQFRINIK